MIHLFSAVHSSNASVSLPIAIRPKAKVVFHTAVMLQATVVSF